MVLHHIGDSIGLSLSGLTGTDSTSGSYSYLKPEITSVSPSVVPTAGGEVTIKGRSFGSNSGLIKIYIGDNQEVLVQGGVLTSTHEEITVTIPKVPETIASYSWDKVKLSVEVAGQVTAQGFTGIFDYSRPTITGITHLRFFVFL